jgi:ATP/ADP translocase
MEWRNNGELEITDLGDRLEVIHRAQQGLLRWVITAVAGAWAVYLFWKSSELLGILVIAILAFSLVNSFRKGNETRLIVRPDGFIAEGNIDTALVSESLYQWMIFMASSTSSEMRARRAGFMLAATGGAHA